MRYTIIKRDDEFSKDMANAMQANLEGDPFFHKDEDQPELVIVIGGDGTFLAGLHRYLALVDSVKFLCFNTGRIGYYNEFSLEESAKIVQWLKEGSLRLRNFSLLQLNDGKNVHYAINEFILSGLMKNVEYDVYLDGKRMEHYFGMGLIVNTCTGSMGYNRSLGGAAIDTDINVMELTEIAAVRSKAYESIGSPVILNQKRVITFEERNNRPGTLLADNIPIKNVNARRFSISMSNKKVACYSMEDDVFLPRLRKTLGF